MKIAVTGVAGFIGSHLSDALIRSGHEVIGVDNLSMGAIENLIESRGSNRFSFHEVDVRDLQALQTALRSADCIVHLAAFKIPRYGNALDTLDVNAMGARNVLECAREGRRRVLLASTSDVYGRNPELPLAESSDTVLGPATVARWSYATSKLWADHMALAYQDRYEVPVTILRLFGTYGPRQHLSWWGGPQSVFISAALRGQPIEIHGDGQQTRSFIYVSDMVEGFLRAIDHDHLGSPIINLGNTEEMTILDLATRIVELCGYALPPALRFIPYASFSAGYEDVRRRIPDISLAQHLLGFHPTVSTIEGLSRTIQWQRTALGLG